LSAGSVDFASGGFQSVTSAGDQSDSCFAFAEGLGRGPADTGRSASDDNDFFAHAMIRSKT
jgi:hypothetical protein